MPELPEVETVRQGLAEQISGRTFVQVRTHHARVARRHVAGPADLCSRLTGRQLVGVERRGKYLWLPLAPSSRPSSRLSSRPSTRSSKSSGEPTDAMLAHLGMSGQFRVTDGPMSDHRHLRFDAELDDGRWLTFLDQRTFGGIGWDALVADSTSSRRVPAAWQHVAPDPFEPGFDGEAVVRDIRRRRSEIKRVLLDQTVVSGIGNIYADEALWRARVHPGRPSDKLPSRTVRLVLEAATEVMAEALRQGGTSFDALYVNVNGESGYFERSLTAYGREDEPCLRCGSPIRRLAFANRSSFVCPRCQRPPRGRLG